MAAKVTIATVARHANVSRQTVSNVLNTPDLVRDGHPATGSRRRSRSSATAPTWPPGRCAPAGPRLIAVRIDPVRDGINGVGARPVPARPHRGRRTGRLPRHALHRRPTTAPRSPPTRTCSPRTPWTRSCSPTPTTATRGRPGCASAGVPFVTFGRPWGDADSAPAGSTSTAPPAPRRRPGTCIDAGPPPDRLPRLAARVRRRRRPPRRLGGRDGRGRTRRRPASTRRTVDGVGRGRARRAASCSPGGRRPRWSAPATRSRSARRAPAGDGSPSSASTTPRWPQARRALQRAPAAGRGGRRVRPPARRPARTTEARPATSPGTCCCHPTWSSADPADRSRPTVPHEETPTWHDRCTRPSAWSLARRRSLLATAACGSGFDDDDAAQQTARPGRPADPHRLLR